MANRNKSNFKESWTNSTFFVELIDGAFCLLCPENQRLFTSNRKHPLERHFMSKHKDIFEKDNESRTVLLNNLIANLDSEHLNELNSISEIRNQTSEEQKKVKIASYILAYNIAKHSKPFEEGEFLKDCLNSVASLLCPQMIKPLNDIAFSVLANEF